MKVGGRTGITVVETRAFQQRAKTRLAARELEELINMIANHPECGVIMEGTGGVRKLRFAPEGRGKSGGLRVVYYFYNETIPLFLLTVFAKNEKDNLTKAERNQLKVLAKTLVKTYGV